jgi:hypothetical protein
MHGCLPVGACENVTKLPEQLLPSSKPKDPAPLPCEDQAAAAKTPWPLAVEDAQVCCYIYIYMHMYIYTCAYYYSSALLQLLSPVRLNITVYIH